MFLNADRPARSARRRRDTWPIHHRRRRHPDHHHRTSPRRTCAPRSSTASSACVSTTTNRTSARSRCPRSAGCPRWPSGRSTWRPRRRWERRRSPTSRSCDCDGGKTRSHPPRDARTPSRPRTPSPSRCTAHCTHPRRGASARGTSAGSTPSWMPGSKTQNTSGRRRGSRS